MSDDSCGKKTYTGNGMVPCLQDFAKQMVDRFGHVPSRHQYRSHLKEYNYSNNTWNINLPRVERWARNYFYESKEKGKEDALRREGRDQLVAQLRDKGIDVEKLLNS
jgi:hypothetical protein